MTYGLCERCRKRIGTHNEPPGVLTCGECCVCVATKEPVHAPAAPVHDGEICPECGSMMQRTGACHTCPECGYNGGCG